MDLPIQVEEKGFTLFEVIFITVILSLGLLTIIEIFPLGFKAKEAAEQYSVAALLGQEIIEEIKRNQGYRYRLEWCDSETPCLRKLKVTILFNNSRDGNTENYLDNEDSSWQCLELVTYLAKKN